jgi:hypothetical protein
MRFWLSDGLASCRTAGYVIVRAPWVRFTRLTADKAFSSDTRWDRSRLAGKW